MGVYWSHFICLSFCPVFFVPGMDLQLQIYTDAFVGQMSRPCSMNGTFVLFSAVVMGHFPGVYTITMDQSQSDCNMYSDSRLLFYYLILAKYLILICHIIFTVLWFTVNSIAFYHSKTSRSTVVSTWNHVIQQLHKLCNSLDSPLHPPALHRHMYTCMQTKSILLLFLHEYLDMSTNANIWCDMMQTVDVTWCAWTGGWCFIYICVCVCVWSWK